METVEDKRTFVRSIPGPLSSISRSLYFVSGDDHFDLPPSPANLHALSTKTPRRRQWIRACAHEGILVAELHEDESEL